MACRTESKTIGDIEYSVTQYPVEKALLMKLKITKALGSPIATMFANGASEKEGESDKRDALAIGKGLDELFQISSPEQLTALVKECVIGVSRDGTRITETSFNELFGADDIGNLYKITAFVIQVNYGNLFKGQSVNNLLAKVTDKL